MSGIFFDVGEDGLIDADGAFPSFNALDEAIDDGTLMLIDTAHSSAPLTVIPGNGALLTNIAVETAADIIGSGDASTLSPSVSLLGLGPTLGVLELTSKKGLHAMLTQTSQVTSLAIRILFPTLIKQYMLDNSGHDFYFEMQEKITRPAVAAGISANVQPPVWTAHKSGSSVTDCFGYLNSADHYPLAGKRLGAQIDPAVNTAGETFTALTVDGYTGSLPSSAANLIAEFGWGGFPGYSSSPWYNRQRSSVFRRFVLKDLTVAGKTHAQARDLGHGQWSRDIANGGRYYGDTPSNPAIAVP